MHQNELMDYWLTEVIIGKNFCPFAARPYQEGTIKIMESSKEFFHDKFLDAMNLLNEMTSEELSTILLYCNEFWEIEDFTDYFYMINDKLAELGLNETYQLVMFHPEFCFDGLEKDDVENYLQRSPFPVIHLLRTAMLEEVSLQKDLVENVLNSNKETLSHMDEQEIKKLFHYL